MPNNINNKFLINEIKLIAKIINAEISVLI